MKKQLLLFFIVVLFTMMLSSCSCVEITDGEVIAVFQYGDADISKKLSDQDCESVKEIFHGKRLFRDSPSCGFSENVALIIGGNTYCIARDSCGVIYDVHKGMYFHLSDSENETLRTILGECGFVFPCI